MEDNNNNVTRQESQPYSVGNNENVFTTVSWAIIEIKFGNFISRWTTTYDTNRLRVQYGRWYLIMYQGWRCDTWDLRITTPLPLSTYTHMDCNLNLLPLHEEANEVFLFIPKVFV